MTDKNGEYGYLVQIDKAAVLKGADYSNRNYGRYATELREMLRDVPQDSLDGVTVRMTKEQLAKFLYLRCRSMLKNGMRELNMRRIPNTSPNLGKFYDMRRVPAAPEVEYVDPLEEPPVPDLELLGKEMKAVDKLLDRLSTGVPLRLDGITFNTKHMEIVLKHHKAHLRAQILAAANLP